MLIWLMRMLMMLMMMLVIRTKLIMPMDVVE